MNIKVAFIALLVIFLLSAFIPQPALLYALPLPEGRTFDSAHDAGYIDWNGAVEYIKLFHRDANCPSGCTEQVTHISNRASVSGTFAGDVKVFKVGVAQTHDWKAGTAVLTACSSSAAMNLYIGPGGGPPGFVNFWLVVPANCRSWSLSASGGYVDFHWVDVNYGSPPPPVSTNTFTPVPTETFTATREATDTLLPGVTPSDTPTPSETPSPTLTSTPSQTLPPGVTPSDTPTATITPVPPLPTNTPVPSSGGGGVVDPPILPFVSFPTATQVRSAPIVPTGIAETSTSQPFSVAALPSAAPTGPLPLTGGAASTGTPLPWLPIVAAAALGTSAVVAKRTETGKEEKQNKRQEQLGRRFPANPIPSSLFPRSVGGGKAVASLKPKDSPPPTPPDKETVELIKNATLAASGTGINIAKVYSYYDSLHDQAGAEYLQMRTSERTAEAARARAEAAQIRANQTDAQAEIADRAATQSDPVQAHTDAAHIDEFQAHTDELTTRATELRDHAEELKARALVDDSVAVEAADAELAAAKAELEAAGERARVEGIKTKLAQAEEAATEAGIARNKTFAANEEASIARSEAIETAGKAADAKTAYADALAAPKPPARNVPKIWNQIDNVLDRIDDGLNRASIATVLMSIAGTTMSALGIKQGNTISDIGTVTGAIVDAGSVVNGIGKFIVACNTKVFPTAGVLGKVAGAVAIPLGLIVGITEGSAAWNDWREDGELSQDGKAAAWNSAGGFLTAAGGVAMLIPGGQIVGGILLAAGGVASGIAWYVKNKEKVDAFVKNTWTSASTAVNKAMTDVKNTVNKAVTAVKETVKKTIDTARTKIAETVTNVTDKAAKAITSAGENISKAVTKVTETTAKVVKAAGEKVAAAVTKVTETVSKAITNTTSAAAKLVSKVSPAAAEKIVQAGQAVSKAVSNAGQTVAKAATKVTETTSKAVSNAGQAVSKAVNTVTQKAANTVKSIGNTISNWFKPKP